MNNQEETDRKYLILKRKEETGNLRGKQEKIAKDNLLGWHKIVFPKEV